MLAEDRTEDRILKERWREASISQQLRSNDPVRLDHPDQVWLVESGALAIFAILQSSPLNGSLKGRRHYLFSVKSGEALFPARATELQLLAVALEATELTQISQADFCDWVATSPETATERLEGWVHRLGSTLAGLTSSTLPTPIANCGILAAGEVFQPPQGSVNWVQILQGEACLLGLEGLELQNLGRIPLQTHLWLQASEVVEVDIRSKRELRYPSQLLEGLNHLQTLVLKGIQSLEQQELHQEYQRFQERERLNTQALTETLTDLAGVFQTPLKPQRHASEWISLDASDALLAAAGAVGRSLGIAIEPPAQTEDLRRLRDPLEAIARASRIRIRRVALRDNWWQKDSGALLAYTLEDRRPVALLPRSATSYQVIDPVSQRSIRCDAQIAAQLSPQAYTFYRPLPARLKPLDLMRFVLRGHWKELGMVLLTGIAATLMGMITPQATAILIDQAIPDADRRLLLQIGLGLFMTAVGASLFQLTQGLAIMRLEAIADATTQAAVWDRLLTLKATFFRQYAIGDLNARVSAVSQIRQKLSSTLLKSLFSSVFSLLNLGLLFYYSVPLALIATGVALINAAVTIVSGVLNLRKVRPLLERQGKLFGVMVQMINGVSKFRVSGAESRAFAHWGKNYTDQLKLTLSSQGIEDNLALVNQLLPALTPIVLFSFATHLLQQSQANNGDFSTGTFLAFNAAFGTFIGGATSLSTTVVDVLEVIPIWQRAQPILNAVPEIDLTKSSPGSLSGQVAVDHAVFRYRTDGALILDNVSIQAEPGEFIALVGPSGSGKSTLFRLLLGFETPESGAITFDGQDLAGLDVNAVRRQLGVVLQNSRLMSASIFENIASSAVISMEEAWEAARLSGFAEDVSAMPMGMHTVVSEGGTNLSGGQRQRLLIARALALRPRVLLFDEATSALDNRTQAIVSASLERLKVTRIVVAHRLSTIRNADRIYVLQQGRVVQQGSFEQLAQQEGLFSQLIQRQRV